MTYRLPDPLPPPPPYWQPSRAFVRALVVLAAFGLGCPDDDELDDELDGETETGGDPCPVDCYVVGDPDAEIVQCFCPTSSS